MPIFSRVPTFNWALHDLCALFLVLIMSIGFGGGALAQQLDVRSVGFKEISLNGVDIGVWYPSDGPINRKTLGPFDVSYSDNGKPLAGSFPIVLLSHGIGSQYRNHHLTAARLVKDGNVVIAPTHARDMTVARRAVITRLEHRQHDLTAALVGVGNDPVLSRVINKTIVKGVGYSLGTATIMIASGASIHTDLLEQHCIENGDSDAEFCSYVEPRFFASLWDWVTGNEAEKMRSFVPSSPLINNNISLIAPIGQGMDLVLMNANAAKIQILALGDDDQLLPEFHAKALLNKIDIDKINYIEYPRTHHFAFIAPFPVWVTEKEDIPVAKDPVGFNRAAFQAKINDDIALFLQP